jgi:hypothetical protein
MLKETCADICTHRDTFKILVAGDGKPGGIETKMCDCAVMNRYLPSVLLISLRANDVAELDISALRRNSTSASRAGKQGDENMLGIIAAILIVLWLLGFFAFHVTTGFIHIVLLVGIVLLILHLLRGRSATA